MSSYISELKEKVLAEALLNKEEAMALVKEDCQELCQAADEIRKAFCGNIFDICTIINGKSGRCSEDCRYCAQAACYQTKVEEYPLLDAETILEQARLNKERGVLRYSIVTSGKRLSKREVERVCQIVERIQREVGIAVCISGGLLDYEDFKKLKEAGVSRVHNNMEASENFFKTVCSTHTTEDKKAAVRAALQAGLPVCSGGIIGLGENFEDRIDMALMIRDLGVKSVPVNVLCPIPGTPYEHNPKLELEEICRTVAIYRFINPQASIRMAGGRGGLPDFGRACFTSGANAAISGDMLTTSGITIENDMKMLKELGFEPGLWAE